MRKLIVLIPLIAGVFLSACGQKGPLYIPPEQQTAASGPPAAAEELDAELDQVERPVAQSQDELATDEEPIDDDSRDGESFDGAGSDARVEDRRGMAEPGQ